MTSNSAGGKSLGETPVDTKWLFHGALAAIGAGLSLGLITAVFSSPGADPNECSRDKEDTEENVANESSSAEFEVSEVLPRDDIRVPTFSSVAPLAESPACSGAKLRAGEGDRIRRHDMRDTACTPCDPDRGIYKTSAMPESRYSQPFCGTIADWRGRQVQGRHGIPLVSFDKTTPLAEKKSTPLMERSRQNSTRYELLMNRRRSSPVLRSGKREEDIARSPAISIWTCKAGQASAKAPSSSYSSGNLLDSDWEVVVKEESSDEARAPVGRPPCTPRQGGRDSTPSASSSSDSAAAVRVSQRMPSNKLARPISHDAEVKALSGSCSNKVLFAAGVRENSLALLAVLSIPEILELIEKLDCDPTLARVGRNLHDRCAQIVSATAGQSARHESRSSNAPALDVSALADLLKVDGLGLTWDSILHAVTRKIRDKSGVKPRVAHTVFGMKTAAVVECKTCDAADVTAERWNWAFPVTVDFAGSPVVRYTLLTCLKKTCCDPVKVRGDSWTKCKHAGNLYRRSVVTAFPDVLVFERKPRQSRFNFPSFPTKLDASCLAAGNNNNKKEVRPRYLLHSVTLSSPSSSSSRDGSSSVYFRFGGVWLTVDEGDRLKKVDFCGSEERFHAERLLVPADVVHLAYVREYLGGGSAPNSNPRPFVLSPALNLSTT